MARSRETAVIGCAIRAPIISANRSLEEILYETGQQALADADLGIDQIDGIVVASNDQFDGRAIAIMAASGSVGGVDRDIFSTPSASEHAFVMGTLRVASGLYETQLIVSWSSTEASSLAEAERLASDPYFNRRLPLDDLSSHAMQAAALCRDTPEIHDMALAVVAKNRRNGAIAYPEATGLSQDPVEIAGSRPVRWPLREQMITPPATGAVALVIASADFVANAGIANPAWIRGMGWATEASFLGDRDLSEVGALAAAAERAYREAGITNPRQAFDVAEVADATPYQELLAYDGLRLSARARWADDVASGVFERTGRLPVNPSGGALTINPVFCAGLIRIAEAANQIRGRATTHQVPNARAALAHAASGFAGQYQTVVVLGTER